MAAVLITAALVGGCETTSSVTETVGPDAVKCQVSVTTPPMVDAGGGTGSFSITTQPECAWTASSVVTWISGFTPASGQGNGNVEFRVAANEGSATREGEIVVNDSRVRVSQRAPCRYQVTPPNQSMHSTGGNLSVSVATLAECAWSASADVNWITLSPPTTGSGNGSVAVSVAPNSGGERVGGVIIAGQRSTITQQGPLAANCTFAITPMTQSVAATAGAGQPVTVSAPPACRWTASSNVPWMTITSGPNGTADGVVTFTVAANTAAARTGTLSIAGLTHTVTQAAPGAPPPPPPPSCTYAISPTSQTITAVGGTGTTSVTTGSNCAWTTTSNVPWITVTSGATGTGSGAAAFAIAANLGGQRTGTLTVAGQTFTVTQAAALPSCTYSIAPTNQSVPATASTGTVNVTAGSGCAWTANSNAPWITVTAGATGSGNGAVGYSVAANTGAARSGTVTIAGQTFTVNQAVAPPVCTYGIAPTSQDVPATASSGTVAVTATGGSCSWTSTSNVPWITITSGATGSGNGAVAYSVAANTGAARSGTLTIAGQTFTVTQAAPPPVCTYAIAPASQNVDLTGGVGTVTVTTTAGCAWTATSNVPWITITGGATGTGSGTVTFVVVTNTGAARTGTLTVAGQTATVQQSGI